MSPALKDGRLDAIQPLTPYRVEHDTKRVPAGIPLALVVGWFSMASAYAFKIMSIKAFTSAMLISPSSFTSPVLGVGWGCCST